MNRRLTLAAILGIVLLAAYVHGQQFGREPSKLDIVKVTDDLFVIHNEFVPGHSTALITNDGVVLVDDKFEIDHENILARLNAQVPRQHRDAGESRARDARAEADA